MFSHRQAIGDGPVYPTYEDKSQVWIFKKGITNTTIPSILSMGLHKSTPINYLFRMFDNSAKIVGYWKPGQRGGLGAMWNTLLSEDFVPAHSRCQHIFSQYSKLSLN